jgi:hypothetical protein
MLGSATEVIVVSKTSMNVAIMTAAAINHGLTLGCHSVSGIPANAPLIAP